MSETVNGKVDMGTRRLITSHVENAASFYAYLESDKDFMTEIKNIVMLDCKAVPKLNAPPKLDQIVGVYSSGDHTWYRGKVEQLGQGKDKKNYRVRMLDFGWNQLYKQEDMYEISKSLQEKEVLCEKYKMSDLKPKGKAEGYSAEDRQSGAEWLRHMVKDKIIICKCYKQVNYAGGIMADCMVGDKNLNKAALQQGHVVVVPAIIASMTGKKAAVNKQPSYQQNRMAYNQEMNSRIDLDYSSYGDSSQVYRGATGVPSSGLLMAGQNGPQRKSVQVKKLEKQIIADKKTINKMKKTTNMDSGIRDITKLMDRVLQVRGTEQSKESKGNYILACLAGVREVIEESSIITMKYLAGVEAVEDAVKRVSEDEKKGMADRSPQTKTDLHKCISAYLEMYSEEEIDDELSRVNRQLANMNPSIPSGWKLLAVDATTITQSNFKEVAEKVKAWMDDSVSRETAATVNSNKEIESLCRTLNDLSVSLQKKFDGNLDVEVPKSIDSQVASARKALDTELSCRVGGKLNATNKGKNKTGSNDGAMVLRLAWKALAALKSQLEFSKKKKDEYDSLLITLLPLM